MRERQPGGRLRLVIGGTIYARRALVRRFLEDDGFSVVAEAVTRHELLAVGDMATADAVVVDGDLLDGSVDELRALAPDAVIVVFTRSQAAASAPRGADGYLDKGTGLASLTALLHSLLTERPTAPSAVAATSTMPPPARERPILSGLTSAAAMLVVVAVVALAVFGSGGVPIDRNVAEATQPPVSPSAGPTGSGPTPLQRARDDLEQLENAIRAGRTVDIGLALDRLDGDVTALRRSGALDAFGTSVSRLLQPLLQSLGSNLLDRIGDVLGQFLDLASSDTTTTDGSGSSGTYVPDGATVATTTDGGTTSGSDGSSDGGSGSTDQGSGAPGGSGGSGGNADGSSNAGGSGHHYGWVHKPPAGGWHGDHPHGNGNGHGSGNG